MAGLLLRLTSALLDKEWGGAPGRMLSGLATGGGDSFWGGWCFWGVGFLGEGRGGCVPLGMCHWGRFRSACLLICLMVWCSNIGSAE